MQHHWISRTGTAELVLVFGGWALGDAPFAGLTGEQDVLFVQDYRRLDDPLPALTAYDRVSLISFSFGVVSAAHWMDSSGFQPDRLIAIAGTLFPADADRGIAPEMIRATADQLTSASFTRFCRRAGLKAPPPEIDIAAAQAELTAVITRGPAPERPFDRIWIPQNDRIIPPQAQEAAWTAQQSAIHTLSAPHVPFQSGQSWSEWMA